MWIITALLGVSLPLFGLLIYDTWRNKQIDKYNEWLKQQEAQEDSPEGA